MVTGERMVHNSVAIVALDYFVLATSLKHSKTQFILSTSLLNIDFNQHFKWRILNFSCDNLVNTVMKIGFTVSGTFQLCLAVTYHALGLLYMVVAGPQIMHDVSSPPVLACYSRLGNILSEQKASLHPPLAITWRTEQNRTLIEWLNDSRILIIDNIIAK